MFNPKVKIITSIVLFFVSGMFLAWTLTAFSKSIPVGLMLLMGFLLFFIPAISTIVNTFKNSHIESELMHRINSIYTDID